MFLYLQKELVFENRVKKYIPQDLGFGEILLCALALKKTTCYASGGRLVIPLKSYEYS